VCRSQWTSSCSSRQSKTAGRLLCVVWRVCECASVGVGDKRRASKHTDCLVQKPRSVPQAQRCPYHHQPCCTGSSTHQASVEHRCEWWSRAEQRLPHPGAAPTTRMATKVARQGAGRRRQRAAAPRLLQGEGWQRVEGALAAARLRVRGGRQRWAGDGGGSVGLGGRWDASFITCTWPAPQLRTLGSSPALRSTRVKMSPRSTMPGCRWGWLLLRILWGGGRLRFAWSDKWNGVPAAPWLPWCYKVGC